MDTLIINNGSGYIKSGLSHLNEPNVIIPCLETNNLESSDFKEPIRNGTVCDWDSLTTIWESIISITGVSPEEQGLLITLPLQNFSKSKLYEIMFEYFNFKSVYIGEPNCLTLYGTARTTGLIYDCGHHLTQINPIFEGYHLDTESRIINLGGRDIDNYLLKKIKVLNIPYKSSSLEVHRFKHQLNSQSPTKYQLPDGQSITLDNFEISEILFKPSLIGKEIKGCQFLIGETINSCDLNVREQLKNNIILSGGTTLINNFKEKLNESISTFFNNNIKVIAHSNQQYLQWKGGSIISQLSVLRNLSVNKNDYNFNNKRIF